MQEIVLLLQKYYDNNDLSTGQILDIVKSISYCIPIKYMMIYTQPKKYIDITYLDKTYTITF